MMERVAAATWMGLAVVFAAVLAAPGGHADSGRKVLSGNQFPIEDQTLFLTGSQATSPDGASLALDRASAGSAGRVTFVAPGINVLGVVTTPADQRWTTTTTWPKDMEVTDAATVVLYFTANAQATTVFEVRLTDIAADGQTRLVSADTQQFVTALNPTPVSFFLDLQGATMNVGHQLRLTVIAQTLNAAVVMDYGGATPSALQGLRVRWLDSDADGVPDSDEVSLGTNPLDPQSPQRYGTDSDKDGLPDTFERAIHTDPAKPDTDGDGFVDGLEVHAGSDPLDPASRPFDQNGNGLPDSFEVQYFNSTSLNQSFSNHTTVGGVDPNGDPDHDGCTNLCEAIHGTDPNNPDTDGDGVLDGKEAQKGTDPLSSGSAPAGLHGIPEPIATAAAFAIASSLILLTLLRRP